MGFYWSTCSRNDQDKVDTTRTSQAQSTAWWIVPCIVAADNQQPAMALDNSLAISGDESTLLCHI
jgi:hypothetical protein